MKHKTIDATIHALDVSRRVGWAKYYDLEQEVERLQNLAFELIDIITFHERIPNGDSAIERANEIRSRIIK